MTDKGVINSSVIDLVTYDPVSEEYKLIMIEERDWLEKDLILKQLKAKIDNYLNFILNGNFYSVYPAAKGKKISLQLDYTNDFDSSYWDALFMTIRQQVQEYGYGFTLNKSDW